MLRTPQLRRQATQSFFCWRCLAKSQPVRTYDRGVQWRSGAKWTSQRNFSGGKTVRAGVEAQSSLDVGLDLPPIEVPSAGPSLRERLRQWEIEHADTFKMAPEPKDRPKKGDVSNNNTRPQPGDFRVEEDDDADELDMPDLIFDRGDLVDVGSRRAFLLAGDLVELLSVGSRQQELAIYIRDLDYQSQFYTMSGRWIHRSNKAPKFYVPNFVEAHELDDIRPYLPQEDVPAELEDKLHSFEQVLPRNIGQPLTLKMSEFWAKADAAYQKAASRFDNAHQIVAHPTRFTYATLDEIAEEVLSKFLPKNDNGKFSQDVLYALHRSLLRDDIGFRAQPAGTLRAGGEYEINSISEVNSISNVTDLIRTYREARMRKPQLLRSHQLTEFANHARRLIDACRQSRELTPYGVIGPYSGELQGEGHFRYGYSRDSFTSLDFHFIRFLESWACLSSFNLNSSLNGIGSTILRIIGRYEDMPLDKKAAWTFLQEIGAIPPWENRVAYELRLPMTGRRLAPGLFSARWYKGHREGAMPVRAELSEAGFREDVIKHLRKDWGNLPVYCVDDTSAHELDDGISVECTEIPEEVWIHIHTADPAAHLDPLGSVGARAEVLTESVYIPERTVTMLPPRFVHENLSLASGRPCLTFSAKMNSSGELLESKVTPGIVRNMVYMTHEVLREVTTGVARPKPTVYVVGSDIFEAKPSRDLLESHQIPDANRKDLEILEKIKRARWNFLGSRGGIFRSPPKSSVSVSFGDAPWMKARTTESLEFCGDPTIQVAVETHISANSYTPELDLVSCFMLAAGEVAARWCHARGIPVPYRITPLNPERDPAEYFQKVYMPAMDESGVPPLEIQMEYARLIPAVQPSTIPGPHVALGMDMMVRCTSPLRRFADILAHWQIEAALLEEERLGHSLVGNTREDFLPFSKERIDALLPRLALREKLIHKSEEASNRSWELQLFVRAWHFKQAEIPSPLVMSVRSVNPDTRLVGGVLEAFLLGVQMHIPEGMSADEIQTDDKFEVEICDIDIWARKVYTNLVKRVES